jgi:glutathione peroxidase
LSNLHREYLDKNLVIIGTPSNSFRQELDDEESVKEFCLVNYDTKFIISEIIDVNGEDAHPIYSWMTSTYNETPKWNFYKYLFDGEGNLVQSWTSITKPDSSKITNLIDQLI